MEKHPALCNMSTAENYHLKWDSHLTYLNSSVATLYKNEKFADVVLYSSSSSTLMDSDSIPTVGISAHKFILSSCSQFFATIFENAPISSPNGVLYVVLPPDLSPRAIQILVQYMYSGEATVSNDILNEVLRGGEILKIRGLCRTSPSHASARDYSSMGSSGTNSSRLMAPVSHTQISSTHYGKCNSRYTIDHAQQQVSQFRGLGASVMPKDSPVIVKSPKLAQMGLIAASSSGKHTGISVNKEVAIDPEDKCCYQMSQQEALPSMGNNATLCSEVGCTSCPLAPDVENLQQTQHNLGDELATGGRVQLGCLERNYVDQSANEHCMRDGGSDRVREYYIPDSYEHPSTSTKQYMDPTVPRLQSPMSAHNYLAIKQEPDWSISSAADPNSNDLVHNSVTPMHSPKHPLDFKIPTMGNGIVKMESGSAHSADEEESSLHGYETYTHLVCETCKKSFDTPKSWVRHLQTHSSSSICNDPRPVSRPISSRESSISNGEPLIKSYVPKKRRRISQQENNMDHVTLLCDLCSTSFETPAEWVRHMNNMHTEVELAMFNNKKENEQKGTHHISHKKYSSRHSLHKRMHSTSHNSGNAGRASLSSPPIPVGVARANAEPPNSTT